MNRDGEGPGTPPEGETPTDSTEDRGADNVIQFPGARLRAAPPLEPTPEAGGDAAATPATDAGADVEPGMTLDAFERAVRSAVRDKLGEGAPQGADELVAQVFSALTGKDAKTALAEVRQRLSEPAVPAPLGEGDVIDLSAVRDARQRANLESAKQIGGALKDSFAQFIAGLARRPGVGGEITLDANFFKQHGPSLLGNLFQGLAAALMQQARPPAPAAGPTAASPAPAAPPAADITPLAPPDGPDGSNGTPSETSAPAPVQVKLDIGSILAGLFRRRDTPPPDGKPPGTR